MTIESPERHPPSISQHSTPQQPRRLTGAVHEFLALSRPIRLDAAAVVYITLPSVCFLLSWVKPTFGLPAALLVLAGLWELFRTEAMRRHGQPAPLDLTQAQAASARAGWLLAVLIALIWMLLSGIGHFVYANKDWVVRDAVLRDMVLASMPVTYANNLSGQEQMLRTALGFFLPAALAGKWLGLRAAELALFVWSLFGVLLTFRLILRDRPPLAAAAVRILVFVFFSGMDVIGRTLRDGYLADPAQHIEFWASHFQFSSNTTLLFWVPNHTLAAWVATAWLLGLKRDSTPCGLVLIVVAMTALWSPLAAFGLAPLALLAVLQAQWPNLTHPARWRVAAANLLAPWAIVVCGLTAMLILPYLLLQGGSIPSGWLMDIAGLTFAEFFHYYWRFLLLEVALIAALLLWTFPRDAMLWMSAALLMCLPFYFLGPSSDLNMRASIPALAVLAIRSGEWLSRFPPAAAVSDRGLRHLMVALLLIGSITALHEMTRAVVFPAWRLDASKSLIEATNNDAPHYLSNRHGPWVDAVLR